MVGQDGGSRGVHMPRREEEAARLVRAMPVMPDGKLAVPASQLPKSSNLRRR